ncbi:RsmE family RNA methyltransferase [Paludicola sp. MB14-C6]|uniref:RsmE family RNA methyltransferase n=1 Tax=Paludihabitans sp. MB14-C6 TaxID=3070656 RepID=UPI0027DB52F0|nr:RsmE family RNA methyltransferase [Paludicola sp. MB14-C6]WMJ22190.1 RsmE family RNA methyltransferase [Paludicola sp. MB14-C6]
MPRFFSNQIASNQIIITGEDAKHITKVLRMKMGEAITVNDKAGTDYECEIAEIGEQVILNVLTKHKNETEPNVEIVLYQALPKSDKLDFIVQKAVELGVTKIVPMTTKFCIAKADEKSFEKKLIRYNKIVFEAAKQSGRGIIPLVENILSFEQAIQQGKDECSILYYEHGGEPTACIVNSNTSKVNIYVGSEGGFSEQEVIYAKEHGIRLGTLGKLILRCETAPIVGLSLVLNATNHM